MSATQTHDDITEIVDALSSMVEPVLTAENEAELLGEDLYRLRVEAKLPRRRVVIGALLSDFAHVAERCVLADQKITDEELDQVYPIFFHLTNFLARTRPDYERFADLELGEQTRQLLAFYGSDAEAFGARCTRTQWVGLDVCRRIAQSTGDEQPLDRYVRAQHRTMERVFGLGGVTARESAEHARFVALLDVRRRLDDAAVSGAVDPRITAFCNPSGPAVFGGIALAHQVWERDPFDAESVHAKARETFERVIDRGTEPHSGGRGRFLVLRGTSGAGKTHLMRAFRSYLHGHGRGFASYMQMSSRAGAFERYLLVKVVDSLERPYDPPQTSASGLITLSDAVADALRSVAPQDVARLRGAGSDGAGADIVSPMVDRLLELPGYDDFDPDLLRVLLYLQRREPRIKARVLKYLRCENLNDYDSRLLGGISPRTDGDAPLRMVEQLGRLMARVGNYAFVLLVDQMEDVFNLEEASSRIKGAIDVLRHLVDHVPTAVVVLSCLDDFYSQVRETLTRSAIDRLESDPPPVTLSAARSAADIRQIVGLRLSYLYDRLGVRADDDDPTFPIGAAALDNLANFRTRDVLSWCREYQQQCIQRGGLVDAPTAAPTVASSSENTDITRVEREWDDFRTTFSEAVPDEDGALTELLAWAIAEAGREFEPELRLDATPKHHALAVDDDGETLLVGICNRSARGGGLGRQIHSLRELAGEGPVGVVRCSEFPDNPRTKVYKDLGAVVRDGGRRVSVEDGDWRTMMALRVFAEQHVGDPGLLRWRTAERPLSQLASLRALLLLDERHPSVASAEGVDGQSQAEPEAPSDVRVDDEPETSAPVNADEPDEPDEPDEVDSELAVGRTAGVGAGEVSLPLRSLVTHAAFLGSTGSGKTTLALNLIEQALAKGIPTLLLDRKGDLCTYARPGWWSQPGRDPESTERKRALQQRVEVAVYTPGSAEGRDLGLPLIPEGLAQMSNQQRASACRVAAAAICTMLGYKRTSSDQARQSVLAKAMEILGQISTEEVGIEQIIALIDDEDPALINAIGRLDTKHFGRLVDHLETLRLTRGDLLDSSAERLNPAELLGMARTDGKTQLSVVSTKFLGDSASIDFWVARLLSELTRWASQNPNTELQALVLLDEADMYMPATRKPATKEPLMDLLRRGRSAGLGVMLATQSPGDLDYKSRDNIRTWFAGRIAENTAIAKMQPLLSDCRTNIKGKLARQDIGEFFMLQSGDVTELRAHRSLMDTEQLAEDEICRLASRGVEAAQ